MLNFNTFTRTPFDVEAVEITDDNFDEIAELIGTGTEIVSGSKTILIDKQKVPTVTKAFVGYFVTKTSDDNLRVFSPRVFKKQFVPKIKKTAPKVVEIPDTFD